MNALHAQFVVAALNASSFAMAGGGEMAPDDKPAQAPIGPCGTPSHKAGVSVAE